ncbi:ATP:cob(I)alamin adenosyltransferase [Rubellicoccus peritrichatus]|uniref:Corrinoid adenosyltransferase n=1 Tax=Rubellicoccus peritrichatus TaxID=3080537 RepID=A0AAQ3LDE8_9BACT|nr:ATP:cob(I)alamin adenosyltransferase [Puniceicoccus sp. CR14]WOO42487.1 ATP:cob(I)alamin adenosyltransferase [Puniceicoccus sp. CR14]
MSFPDIATKTGDDGETSLWCGKRVPKTDPRVRTVGQIDLALSALGRCYYYLDEEDAFSAEVKTELLALHRRFVTLMGEIATREKKKEEYVKKQSAISKADVAACDALYEKIRAALGDRGEKPVRWRIYGEGGPAAAEFYYARGVFRQSELALWSLRKQGFVIRNPILKFLNRFSDLLFYIAVYLEE